MSALYDRLLDIFLPATCVGCGSDIVGKPSGLSSLCPPCLAKIRWRFHPEFFDELKTTPFYAVAAFDGPMRTLLHRFKYQGREQLNVYLVDRWVRHCPFKPQDIDLIVPVPMPLWKVWHRGYNPVQLLVQAVAVHWKKPIHGGGLRRGWMSRSQTTLSRRDRFHNATRSYRLGPHEPRLKGKSVLLFDDICTTGATLKACTRLLYNAGAAQVWAGAIARDVL